MAHARSGAKLDVYKPDQALKSAGVKESLTILLGQPHGFRFVLKHLNLAADIQDFLDTVWADQDAQAS